MRRHPIILRIAAASAAVIALVALAILWQLRPGLPHISSPGASFTSELAEQGFILVIWLLAIYVALSVFVHAAHAVIHPPRQATILPGVIPSPPRPRPRAAAPRTARPKFALTLVARPDANSADTPAAPTAPAATPSEAPAATVTLAAVEQRPVLSISLLGPLRIDGTSQPPRRVPTRELIAYLALHPHGASRDELIEALWPAQDPKKTRRRLWDLATDARATLSDALIHEGERYRLDRAKVHIDLDQLDQLLANTDHNNEPESLEAALALWRGEPLEGSDYAWADGEIRRLTATFLGLLERAGHARLDRGDARGALEMAEQAIALDQFHEASWRLALQAEHALGLRESITKRYDNLTQALDQELGLQPTRETRVMYRQLLAQD